MKIHKICAFIILLLGIGVTAYSAGRVLEAAQIYQEGDAVYENLRGNVRKNKVSHKNDKEEPQVYIPRIERIEINPDELNPAADDEENKISSEDFGEPEESKKPKKSKESEEKPQVYIPRVEINYDELNSINNDAAAWLYCPNTVIDYPVMKANDYSYYLTRLPDGTQNANGSLFIDYNCASDFSGKLTVIYGHHMKSGSMFGSLKRYKEQEYYDKHPFMYLYTEQGNYRVELIYSCVMSAGQWEERGFIYPENIGELLAYAADSTTFESGIAYEENNRLLVLSTCSYEFDNARFVVIGILKDEY